MLSGSSGLLGLSVLLVLLVLVVLVVLVVLPGSSGLLGLLGLDAPESSSAPDRTAAQQFSERFFSQRIEEFPDSTERAELREMQVGTERIPDFRLLDLPNRCPHE